MATTHEKMALHGPLSIIKLLGLSMSMRGNEHGEMVVSGYLDPALAERDSLQELDKQLFCFQAPPRDCFGFSISDLLWYSKIISCPSGRRCISCKDILAWDDIRVRCHPQEPILSGCQHDIPASRAGYLGRYSKRLC